VAGERLAARNVTRGTVLATDVEVASGLWGKFMGLMGRPSLADGAGLWLPESNGIHMMFMRFAIDAVFLGKPDPGRDGARPVVSVHRGLRAWTGLVPLVRGANGVQMTVGNELHVTGGGGLLSPALLTSGGDIELTIGRAVRVNAGAGLLSIARVQLETRGGVIRLTFPELSHGGYFVNGIEGRTHQGQSGFFSVLRPAKVGRTLLLDYGT